jgi:hypothetical protein
MERIESALSRKNKNSLCSKRFFLILWFVLEVPDLTDFLGCQPIGNVRLPNGIEEQQARFWGAVVLSSKKICGRGYSLLTIKTASLRRLLKEEKTAIFGGIDFFLLLLKLNRLLLFAFNKN